MPLLPHPKAVLPRLLVPTVKHGKTSEIIQINNKVSVRNNWKNICFGYDLVFFSFFISSAVWPCRAKEPEP